MKEHHKRLLETGDIAIYPIVFEASYGKGGDPFAVAIFMIFCGEAFNNQSLIVPFSFETFKKKHRVSMRVLKSAHEILLKFKCIEYTKGPDKRKKYIKILV